MCRQTVVDDIVTGIVAHRSRIFCVYALDMFVKGFLNTENASGDAASIRETMIKNELLKQTKLGKRSLFASYIIF